MKALVLAAALIAAPAPAVAQDAPQGAPSPGEIVDTAAPSEWQAIAPEDLLVMTLAPDRDGKPRQAVIQLIPPPFSQPWVANIRTLAKAHWWDGLAIVRVQDNYVVQWGDPDGEDAVKAKALPNGLKATSEAQYVVPTSQAKATVTADEDNPDRIEPPAIGRPFVDRSAYAPRELFQDGWPIAAEVDTLWPIHCYGMVGVGRNSSPDAGTGAELYAVIGHAPRHLDRNIALVGRVIAGMEHLSSLPRGTGPLGFYETPAERTGITAIRLASQLPAAERPRFEFLATDSATFARYAQARANRRDPFFIVPAGGADICNIPVPVRRVGG